MKDKKNKSKNIDSEPREYRTKGTRKIKDEGIATAANKCFVICNTILNDMNIMMIK